jgi:Ni,Fe-hydrogenase III large subunit/Ni,Fe-hydrogenase III component G
MTTADVNTLLEDSRLQPGPSQQAPNETLVYCDRAQLPEVARLIIGHGGTLATTVGLDLTPLTGDFAVEFVFSLPAQDQFLRVRAQIPSNDREYPSVSPWVPAALWHEREMKDMLGLTPVDHPDPRRLVLHDTWPHGYHPLLKSVSAIEPPPFESRRYDYFEVHGEGIYELAVGPIHAGVIEPGHFRFSNIGELILHLDARLFFTHRGVEKIVEGLPFDRALYTAERTCGACTVSHAVAFCSAVERMTDTDVPARATCLRTLLLELERLYNHVGDIGNICAGAGFHAGSSRGAILKERLQRLNEELTGHRFLMGIVGLGGLRYEPSAVALAALPGCLAGLKTDFSAYLDTVLEAGSFVHRIKGPGHLSAEKVRALGGTGVAARASGIETDYRVDHPTLSYPGLIPGIRIEDSGDVAARLLVRAAEAGDSIDMALRLVEGLPGGLSSTPVGQAVAGDSALGYNESPRGSNVHWLMAGPGNTVYRLRIRSASYANWPLVPRAVAENVVPDFPLINKSFELCYACCDR